MEKELPLSKLERFTCRLGYMTLQVWRGVKGWRFDGPTGAAPPSIRRNPRGSAWSGEISPQFANTLLKRLRERGYSIEVVPCPLVL